MSVCAIKIIMFTFDEGLANRVRLPSATDVILFLFIFNPPSLPLPLPSSTPFAPLSLSLPLFIYLAYFLSRSSFCSLSIPVSVLRYILPSREAPSFGLSCDSTREENMWLYPLQFHKVHSAPARPSWVLPCSCTASFLPPSLPPSLLRPASCEISFHFAMSHEYEFVWNSIEFTVCGREYKLYLLWNAC